MKKENLANVVNDKTRRVSIRGKEAIVPLKFGTDGQPATIETLILKRLSLADLRFLSLWRDSRFEEPVEKLAVKANLAIEKVERLIKKLSCFREEDARVRALSEIPTPSWIVSKHVENVYNPTLEDSQQKSLAELAKIEGAYKNTAQINIQNNVFQMPQLDAQAMAELKALGDKFASVETSAENAA